MPRLSGNSILVTPAEDLVLNRLTGALGTPQKLFARVRLILLAAGGTGVREISRQLDIWPKTVHPRQRKPAGKYRLSPKRAGGPCRPTR